MGLPLMTKQFLALLLCPCSGEYARELSPLNQEGSCQDLGNYLVGSVTPPKLLGPENNSGQGRSVLGEVRVQTGHYEQ